MVHSQVYTACWTARLADSVLAMIKFMDQRLKPGDKKGKSGTDDSDDLTNLYVER